MDRDFHYYVTYIAAVTAGWSQGDAQVIAHAAQYVDDCDPDSHSGTAKFTYANKEYGIINTCFTNPNSAWLSTEADHTVWIPFHFLPGNYQSKNDRSSGTRNYLPYNGKTSSGTWRYDDEKKEFFKRLCIPKSYMAELMINDTGKYCNEPFFKELVGIRMHVLADTVAHAFYSGMLHWYMNDVIGDVYDYRHGKIEYGPNKEWSSIPDFRYESVFYLGHGRIGHIPDYAYCNYTYMPQWNQEKQQSVYINHTRNYKMAFRLLVQAMYCLKEKKAFTFGTEYTAGDKNILPILDGQFTKDIGFYHEQNDYDKNVDRRCEGYDAILTRLGMGSLPKYDRGKWFNEYKNGTGKNFVYFNFGAIKHFQMVKEELCSNNITIFDRFRTFDDAALSKELNKIQTPFYNEAGVQPESSSENQPEPKDNSNFSVNSLPVDQSIFHFFDFYYDELKASDLFGTNRSAAFDDLPKWQQLTAELPTEIIMRTGDVIDCVTLKYGNDTLPAHGGNGGTARKLTLNTGEYVTRISGAYGRYWNQTFITDLMFYTNQGRSIGKLDTASRYTRFDYPLPAGCMMVCMKGFTNAPTGDPGAVGKEFLSGISLYYKKA